MRNKENKYLNFITYCLLIAVLIILTCFGFSIKKASEESMKKDLKISVLINEVGNIQNQLNQKENSLNNIFNDVSSTNEKIKNINQKIENSIQQNETDWGSVKEDLHNSNSKLESVIYEKEKIIADLAIKNKNLELELNIPQHDPSLLDILIVGHNAKLTDTMILASVNPAKKSITLLSIPRDLYHNGRKLNELYSKYGIEELQKGINEITGVFPEKYVIFDFQSFVDLVDVIGGVEIEVKKQITDYYYPGPNNSYTTVSFNPGVYKMDGEKALKYARSRKSTSDFDRSERQHNVITAVKERAKEINVLTRLDLSTKIFAKVQNNISTNINLFEGLSYLQHYQNYNVKSGNVLSSANYLYSSKSSTGQYILLPRGRTYAQIKEYVIGLLN